VSRSSPDIVVFPDRAALARNAATRFIAIAQDAMRARTLSSSASLTVNSVEGKFSVALSGGSTPRDLFTLLATQEFSSQVDWSRVHLFWGDERCVPPDHPDSNFKMANDALISRVPIPAENVHRVRAEIAPEDAAREYEETIRAFLDGDERGETRIKQENSRKSASIRVPVFDLVLLGLGSNAHTASLFPHTPVLGETSRWVAAQYVDTLNTYRITFTPPLINAAKNILFLVAGADKANAVYAVLRGNYSPDEYPAQLIQPTQGKVTWLLDQAANEKLTARN